jgi:hypothetical protein
VLVTDSVVPISPILLTLMQEALSSTETSVLTRITRRYIPEDAVLHLPKRLVTYFVFCRIPDAERRQTGQ